MTTAIANHNYTFNIKLKLDDEEAKIYKKSHHRLETEARNAILKRIERERHKKDVSSIMNLCKNISEEAKERGLTNKDIDEVIKELS